MATIKDVARAAEVSIATVSAVVNGSAYVSPELRIRVETAIETLGYTPSQTARNLKRGRSQLIALVVADFANPFYARIACAAEATVAAWGYSLVIFNSDEKPDKERQILERIQMLSCDGIILVPVDETSLYARQQFKHSPPMVLFGRSVEGDKFDSVTIDNRQAAFQITNYLLDLGHLQIGSITGPEYLSTGRDRLRGMKDAMVGRGVDLRAEYFRCGEFREEVAYSVAREMLAGADRPTALYVANGVMALGVMRALADLDMRCPTDLSLASTDTIPGIGGLRPRLTRIEHPATEMVNEAVRLLIDRIERSKRNGDIQPRGVVFQPTLVVGDSCAPVR